VKFRDQLCACFIGDISEFETALIGRTLDILYTGVDQSENPNFTFVRDRDILSLAIFILKHSETLKNKLKEGINSSDDRS
jgi:hypothetical protein